MDIRAALVVLPAGTAETVFLRMVHQDYRYTMSCVILLSMKDMALFVSFSLKLQL